MPVLIKAKQLEIESVVSSLIDFFNDPSNVDERDSFVAAIKDAPEFDEKVKADELDDTPADYLSQKITGSIGSDITISTGYNNTLKKVVISGMANIDNIATAVGTKFIRIFFEVPEGDTLNEYSDSLLINKTILYLIREHSFLYSGLEPDEYQFDPITGTISFNSIVGGTERISILSI